MAAFAGYDMPIQFEGLIAELALRGPVTVLDGGNCFPAYRIAQFIRSKSLQVEAISRRIFMQRAFTCYQMEAVITEKLPAFVRRTGTPVVIDSRGVAGSGVVSFVNLLTGLPLLNPSPCRMGK